MSSEIAIRVSNLSKCYQIYEKPRDRLKQSVTQRFSVLARRQPKIYFREFWALRDIDLEVKKGETVGIIGRNGSGKSTLLQIVCGTLTPSAGSVEVSGRVAALLELGAGFNPEFTGRENVYMNATLLGLSKEEIDSKYDDIVAFAEIEDFIDHPVKTYSSGMYLRLAFAVIAHVDADILVIDEALSVGDAFFVQKCMRYLRRFMETGTILFVSHDTGAVINLCQQAFWLHKGKIVGAGKPKDVAESYLAAMYEESQGQSATTGASQVEEAVLPAGSMEFKDMRLDFINSSKFRNDIELFQFDPRSESFGRGGAHIESVRLLDGNDQPLCWVVGGEEVCLLVQCRATADISGPIIGFLVKDRLGQTLFGDNTYLRYQRGPFRITEGQRFEARFSFRMPILPLGDYSVCVAVAEGTQQEHIQHQWIFDAMLFKSHSTSVCTGLVGIGMKDICIEVY